MKEGLAGAIEFYGGSGAVREVERDGLECPSYVRVKICQGWGLGGF
jgi:hypothetical protein